ncbi:hypothetical protein PT2222_230029 [Paraburkholderia tropica]
MLRRLGASIDTGEQGEERNATHGAGFDDGDCAGDRVRAVHPERSGDARASAAGTEGPGIGGL